MLDPFVGSGTTCRVAKLLGRRWIGIDLNPEYIAIGERRVGDDSTELDSVDPRLARVPRDLPNREPQTKTGKQKKKEPAASLPGFGLFPEADG